MSQLCGILFASVAIACFLMTDAYPSGAPESACIDMTPQHGSTPQEGEAPVTITLSSKEYTEGSNITVTIQAKDGGTFKGFFVQARPIGELGKSGTIRYGMFNEYPANAQPRCKEEDGTQSAVTHTDRNEKTNITITWQAPTSFTKGKPATDLQFWVTIVVEFSTYWVGIKSEVIKYAGASETTTPEEHTSTKGTPAVTPESPTSETTTPEEHTSTKGTPSVTPESPNLPISTTDCGLKKSCFRSPANCEQDCEYILTWRPRPNSDYMDFELGGAIKDDKYIATGFSKIKDSMYVVPVVLCRFNETNGQMDVLSTENTNKPSNRLLSPSTLGLDSAASSGGQVNGFLFCHFSYAKNGGAQRTLQNLARVSPFDDRDVLPDFSTRKYYLIFAKGPLGDSSSGITYHRNRIAGNTLVDFLSGYVNIGGTTKNKLIKAHGSLMIIAWMICSGVGLLMPRYFKKAWPRCDIHGRNIWFIIHMSLMITVFLLTTTAFILIFVHAKGFSSLYKLPDQVHPIIGIIVMALALMNPIGGLLRCSPSSSQRWIFNWVHRIIGQTAFMGAVTNIVIATFMANSNVDETSLWYVVAYVAWHVITEMVLALLTLRNDSQVYDLTCEVPQKQNDIDWPNTCVLVGYVLGVLALSLRLIFTIAASM